MRALIEAESGLRKAAALSDLNPAAAAPELLRSLAQRNIQVLPLAQDLHWLQAQVLNARPAFGDSGLALLSGLAPQLAWLDLRGAALQDYRPLGALLAWRRLDLSGTSFSGKDLPHLQGLTYLEALNLYGTSIGDADITMIGALPALRQVNLSGTPVSPAGLAALRQSRPELRVTGGSAFPDSLLGN